MSRPILRISALAVIGLLAAIIAIPASSSASSAQKCKLGGKEDQSFGPAYIEDPDATINQSNSGFRVSGTSCSNGKKVIRAFHACRYKKGKKGRCTTKVLGYKCTETRPSDETIPSQYTGHVTCKRGTARIRHNYQQNT